MLKSSVKIREYFTNQSGNSQVESKMKSSGLVISEQLIFYFLAQILILYIDTLHYGSEAYVVKLPTSYSEHFVADNSSSGQLYGITEIPDNDSIYIEQEFHGSQTQNFLTSRNGQTVTKTKKPPKKQGSGTSKQVVEIAVFADPFLYSKLRNKFPTDTANSIRKYILTLVNTMNILYQQPSLKVPVSIKLVHLEIQETWPSSLLHSNGEVARYLESFCDYAGGLNKDNKRWDHGMMLTGADIHEKNDKSIAGVAYSETMCNRYYSCSLNEAADFGSAFVIAHELGHSLGMDHDGEGPSRSCHKAKFIMAAFTGSGQVTWSTCSRKNFQDFLQYGTAVVKKKAQHRKPTCLTAKSAKAKAGISYSSDILPGQKYGAELQCLFFIDSTYTPHLSSKVPYNNICEMLHCTNKVRVVPAHPAIEGTPCPGPEKSEHVRNSTTNRNWPRT